MSDSAQIFTLQQGRGCLACAFTVEALMDSIEANTFSLCRAHMLRASVHMSAEIGERHLRPLD